MFDMSTPKESVADKYKIGKILGKGGFATVRRCLEKSTGKKYACKVITLPSLSETRRKGDPPNTSTREDIVQEINILVGLKHKNVTYLKEYFEEKDKVYLVMELVEGGELLDELAEQGSYSENDARRCFQQVLEGIQYLHSKNVTHRDLTLENLLLGEKGKLDTIKICDFGLSKQTAEEQAMDTICGSPQYVAPEVLSAVGGHYGKACDLWSAGVILFCMLGGYHPFESDHDYLLFKKIQEGSFEFHPEMWEEISPDAKSLIMRLLTKDPKARITAVEALKHPWMTRKASSKMLLSSKSFIRPK
jgi:serine/threonine protein kinase